MFGNLLTYIPRRQVLGNSVVINTLVWVLKTIMPLIGYMQFIKYRKTTT
jgi:hypothetical protein